MRLFPWLTRLPLATALAFPLLAGDVVINEVMYHPPGDRDELQFIELHNRGSQPVELKGWSFTKGVQFTFPARTLSPGGFVVVCRQTAAFTDRYGATVPLAGEFAGRLKHGGERLELSDASGQVADTVKFGDEAPWPVGADGLGASLERISPAAPSDEPQNWAASTLPPTKEAAGSPGKANSAFSSNLPPLVRKVEFAPPQPNQPTAVSVTLSDADGFKAVELLYQVIQRDPQAPETVLKLARDAGNETEATFRGSIPAQAAGNLLRFRVRATDATGAVRLHPAPQEPQPSFSAFLLANTNRTAVNQIQLFTLGARDARGNSRQMRFRRGGDSGPEPARGQSLCVLLPTNGAPVETYDYVRLSPRNGGWKVRVAKGQLLAGISTLNLAYEGEPRYPLAEVLGYELFRRSGAPTPLADIFRVTFDGRPLGYHLGVEQPNSSFLRRVGRDPDGDLFKLIWYGQGVVGQHEKKNNPESGHRELVAAIDGLRGARGEAQWQFIESHFNVDGLANHYAVGLCLQNWDGFFNNYFTYRSPGTDGKWELIPWDLDKTWGDYDGASPDYDWYSMPLTYAMAGDKDSESGGFFQQRTHPWGVTPWWRPGGYFSGPQLANAQFRARFLRRLHELCQTTFTEQQFGPVIDALARRMEPEIRFRAALRGHDVEADLADFKRNLASFRNQLNYRRAFLLKELAKALPKK